MSSRPPSKKPFPVLAVVIPLAAIGVMIVLLAVWQFLTPAERAVPVPYSDFMAEVHAGNVLEIRIHDREIQYRSRGADGRPSPLKSTTGPVPDQHLYDSLKPDDASAPPPKVYFEK